MYVRMYVCTFVHAVMQQHLSYNHQPHIHTSNLNYVHFQILSLNGYWSMGRYTQRMIIRSCSNAGIPHEMSQVLSFYAFINTTASGEVCMNILTTSPPLARVVSPNTFPTGSTRTRMYAHSLAHQQIEALEGLLHLRQGVGEEQRTPQGVGVEQAVPQGVGPTVASPQVEGGTYLHNR